MFCIGEINISCNCIGEPYLSQIVEEFERLQAANAHNERVIKICNQKINELELWNRDYREAIDYWRAKINAE